MNNIQITEAAFADMVVAGAYRGIMVTVPATGGLHFTIAAADVAAFVEAEETFARLLSVALDDDADACAAYVGPVTWDGARAAAFIAVTAPAAPAAD